MLRARKALGLLAVGLVLATAGCDSSSGGEAKPTTEPVKLFVPCDGISDDVVRQAGADPATEDRDIAGVHQTDMEICSWKGAGYFLVVYSWPHSLGQLRADADYTGFEDKVVSGRRVLQFRQAADSYNEDCDIAFSAAQGSISVGVQRTDSKMSPDDPCATATRLAEVLAPEIPA